MLESTRKVNTIVLDKTGTVTEGRMQVVDVLAVDDTSVAEVLRYAGAVESRSEHPIAQAIAAAAAAAADAATESAGPAPAGLGAAGAAPDGVGADGVQIGSD